MRAIAFVPPTDQITIGLDANYAPLQSVDKDGLPHGYDIDFTRELMKRMGIKYYYVPNLWNKVATSVLSSVCTTRWCIVKATTRRLTSVT